MEITPEQREAWRTATRDSPFNQWLRARTTAADGSLDLVLLCNVAAEYRVDAGKYAHLNPGQQRMNVGNRLRPLVPDDVVHRELGAVEQISPTALPVADGLPTRSDGTAWPYIHTATTLELLRIQAAAIDELRGRGVVRTGNAPLGDFAEHLFATAFAWSLTPNSANGYDATDKGGNRYQVKARRIRQKGTADRQLSAIRNLPALNFDFLAAVLFDSDFTVYRAAIVPHSVVLARAVHIKHVNGWRFVLEDAVWQVDGVQDVTDVLRDEACAFR